MDWRIARQSRRQMCTISTRGPAAACAGEAVVWRQRLPEAEGTDPRQGTASKRLHQRAGTKSQGRAGRRRQTGKKPYQVNSADQGRACVCLGQATIGLHEGVLSRVGQEGQPCLHGIGQNLPGARSADGRGALVVNQLRGERAIKNRQNTGFRRIGLP